MPKSSFLKVPARCLFLVIGVFSLGPYSSSLSAEERRVTVINYSGTDGFVGSVAIPLAAFGVPAGVELTARDAEGMPVPLVRVSENGEERMRAILSLEPNGRAEITVAWTGGRTAAEPVGKAHFDLVSGRGVIGNGILEMTYGNGRWKLAFEIPAAGRLPNSLQAREVVTGCRMDTWLDVEDRGRIMEGSPEAMGLVPTSEARLAGGNAAVNEDGSVTLTLEKSFDGIYDGIHWTETFTLPAGLAVLNYHTRFENRGEETRYLAYVRLGGGIKGFYGPLLRAEPRFKYDHPDQPGGILLTGPSNTYTRIAWRQERSWAGVGAGLGVGLGISTTESIPRNLPGNTVWSFVGRNDFEVAMLDRERNQPYEIPAGKAFENSLAFMVSSGGVSVHHQARELWRASIQGRTPNVATPLGVFLEGVPLATAEVAHFRVHDQREASDRLVVARDGIRRSAPLEIMFNRSYQLSVTAGEASGVSPVTVSARAWGTERAVELVSLERAGEEKTVDFTGLTGWENKRQAFVLKIGQPEGARLGSLRLQPEPFPTPELSSPARDLSITNIATFFRWKGIPGALDYELQMSREPAFGEARTFKVRSEIDWPVYLPADDELPEAGEWFWRVRAVEPDLPGHWSEARRLVVNDDHSPGRLQVSITPRNPILTFEAFRVTDFSKFKETIPADLRPYTAINTAQKFDLLEFLRPLAEIDQKVFIRTHHPGPMTVWTPLADVEEIFQTYPNVIGIMGGEALSASYQGGLRQVYTNRLLKLCGKYGRIFYEADGTYAEENKWEALYEKNGDLMRKYAPYLVFAQKNNILHRQFVTQSSVLGLYLSGKIQNQGAWEDGGWYWQQAGFRGLGEMHGQRGGEVRAMPKNFWNLTFLMGLSRGTSIFSLEGQTGTVRVGDGYRIAERGLPPAASPSAYWTTEGELTPVFHRYIAPFFRAVVDRQLVPEKEDLLANIRIGVFNDGAGGRDDSNPFYPDYWELFANTYGFSNHGFLPGELMEFFPNTGRYFFIPIFPQGETNLGPGIEIVPLSQLQDPAAVRARLDQAYPNWYDGEAFVTLVGDTLAIMNSHENYDEAQGFDIPLDRGDFRGISGTIEPHAYVMGKFEDNDRRLWLQANVEYAERPTKIEIRCAREPAVSVIPASAARTSRWDAQAGVFRLMLDHAEGAVEVEVEW